MCKVSTPQWPSTQITFLSQTRQSAWCSTVMTPRVKWCELNGCELNHLFLEGVKQQTKLPGKTGNAFFNALPMSHFQKIVAATAKKNSARCTVQKDARGVDFLSNPEPNNLRYCLLHCPRVHMAGPMRKLQFSSSIFALMGGAARLLEFSFGPLRKRQSSALGLFLSFILWARNSDSVVLETRNCLGMLPTYLWWRNRDWQWRIVNIFVGWPASLGCPVTGQTRKTLLLPRT